MSFAIRIGFWAQQSLNGEFPFSFIGIFSGREVMDLVKSKFELRLRGFRHLFGAKYREKFVDYHGIKLEPELVLKQIFSALF